MLQQSLLLNIDFSKIAQNANRISVKTLLADIVHESHLLYYMEKRDRPNDLIRLLVELYTLGVSKKYIAIAYQRNLVDVELIKGTSGIKIKQDNWKDHLGDGSNYKAYVLFFDEQMQLLGLEETLNRYFYSIEPSIGSQLQPLVQLSFAIEHNLPEAISQALAYYATSYFDVSNILSHCEDSSSCTQGPDHAFVNKILFELVYADQRFNGKFVETGNTWQSFVKVLLTSQASLLKVYMDMWSRHPSSNEERLDMLVYTALTLIKVAARPSASGTMEMDWFLAGGQLLASALAIKNMPRVTSQLIHMQFLATLCTFVIQGKPLYHHKWDCAGSVREILRNRFDDVKLVLTLSAVLKTQTLYPQYDSLCLEVIQVLTQFSKNGAWIKRGLGWP